MDEEINKACDSTNGIIYTYNLKPYKLKLVSKKYRIPIYLHACSYMVRIFSCIANSSFLLPQILDHNCHNNTNDDSPNN